MEVGESEDVLSPTGGDTSFAHTVAFFTDETHTQRHPSAWTLLDDARARLGSLGLADGGDFAGSSCAQLVRRAARSQLGGAAEAEPTLRALGGVLKYRFVQRAQIKDAGGDWEHTRLLLPMAR